MFPRFFGGNLKKISQNCFSCRLLRLLNSDLDSMKTNKMSTFLERKTELREIFNAGIKAVLPQNLIKSNVTIVEDCLQIGNEKFSLTENIYLIGFGKAVMGMAIALEGLLGERLKKGIVSIPTGSKNDIWKEENLPNFPKLTGVIEYREGALHNQPDKNSLETTHDILDFVEGLKENDTLIVLISGGGSALLFMPRPLISAEEKQEFCKNLQNSGANIMELNTVRKKLSMVKGGGLAKIAYPATIISLIISDIVSDPIDLIASGPTVYKAKPTKEVLEIVKKYDLLKDVEGGLKALLNSKEPKEEKDVLNKKKQFKHVHNVIIGNNLIAMNAAREASLRKNLQSIILRNDVQGDVQIVSNAYTHFAFLVCLALEKLIDRRNFFENIKSDAILAVDARKVDEIFDVVEENSGQGIILIGGGEPTVKVKGSGQGGRNQELALYFSLDWLLKVKQNPNLSKYEVIILSGGTDGQDGPTDAAGAFGYPAIAPIILDLQEKVKKLEKIKKLPPGDFNIPFIDFNVENMPKNLESIAKEIENLIPMNVLKENNTYNFYSRFKKGEDLIKTGLTGTNVMDLHFVYIRKRQCECSIDFSSESETLNPFDEHDLHSHLESNEIIKEKVSIDKELELINIRIDDDNFESTCCSRQKRK